MGETAVELKAAARVWVTIVLGRKKFTTTAVALFPVESGEELLDYARRHPAALKNLARMVGYKIDGSEADCRALGKEGLIPVVRFETK